MNKPKLIETCKSIANDMKEDAMQFDGKPFDGKTVAQYFGYQGAAIAALAQIIALLLEEQETKCQH